jgi:tetratricopeptide (TPR) repeat protein
VALGLLLVKEGKFGEAIPSLQRGLEQLPADNSRRPQLEKLITQCKQLLEFDHKLSAVLKGEVQVDAPDRIGYATLCRYKQRNAAAARLYAEAFAQQPALADDVSTDNRYNAACTAALAGVGKGEDASALDDKERTRLRNEALDWLRADLNAWAKQAESDNPQARQAAAEQLRVWQCHVDFGGVRDEAELKKLPEDEQAAWQRFWADVAAAYRKAIEFKPDDADAYYNLGVTLADQNKPAEAEAAFRKALELKPDDADAYNGLGNALFDQDKPAEAEAA